MTMLLPPLSHFSHVQRLCSQPSNLYFWPRSSPLPQDLYILLETSIEILDRKYKLNMFKTELINFPTNIYFLWYYLSYHCLKSWKIRKLEIFLTQESSFYIQTNLKPQWVIKNYSKPSYTSVWMGKLLQMNLPADNKYKLRTKHEKKILSEDTEEGTKAAMY